MIPPPRPNPPRRVRGFSSLALLTAGTTSLTYDFESRVKSISGPGVSNSFAYNGLDARVGKVDSGGTATYRRDGADVLAPVLGDGSAVYTPGVSQRRAGATTFDLSDRLGTASRQTNASKATTATRTYDAFGMLLSSTGSPKGPFGFAGGHGYQEDGDTGLKLLGHRYYDPSTGRFLTRDPVGDGRNWYGHVGNNPLSNVDPEGLKETVPKEGSPEYKKIKDRIDSLRANGETAAADELQDMLDNGKIVIEDDPRVLTHPFPDGKEFVAGAQVPKDGSKIVINADTLKRINSAPLEALLLHEWVHVSDAHQKLSYLGTSNTRPR